MTTEIRFYHFERQNLDQILPGLITKALETGRRIVIRASDEKEVQRLNEHLWTFDPASFIPHGSAREGRAEMQPVWLTAQDENPNGADMLILTDGVGSSMQGSFALCCDMLDGRDAEAVSAARARWKQYKDQGFNVTYWQQTASGWEKKS